MPWLSRVLRGSKIFLLIILSATSSFLILTSLEAVKPAAATTTLASNREDKYSGTWTGLRPQGPNELLTFNQTVSSIASDSKVDVMLSSKVYNLLTGATDQVKLNFDVAANSRRAVAYSITGPNPLPSPYSINTATQCSPCDIWVNLPTPLVYYGRVGYGGTHDRIYISSDGYLSVNGPSSPGILGPGVIAPFSRCLANEAGGRIYYWSGQFGDFFVAWDRVPTCGGGGDPQSFLVWIHPWSDSSVSPFMQSGIEFRYNSVTPGDGVQTAVGIADQQGGRVFSINPTLLGSGNRMLQFKAVSGPKYLNSFTVTIEDTTGGVSDINARVIFDPTLTPEGYPVGYNVHLRETIPCCLISVPEYARTLIGLFDETASDVSKRYSRTAGIFVNKALLAVDTWNLLVESYWGPQLMTKYNQASFADSNPARIKVRAAQNGAVIPNDTPVDASFGAILLWQFQDSQRNVAHHLRITATVGYSDASFWQESDQYTFSTSVDLDILPSYKVFSDNFEDGLSPWVASNPASPAYTWKATANCPTFNSPSGPQPNCLQGTLSVWSDYAPNMYSQMLLNLPTEPSLGRLVNYDQMVLYLHLWVETECFDGLNIDYYDQGLWLTSAVYYCSPSTTGARSKAPYAAWINPRLVFPSTTTAVRLLFVTDSDGPDGQGVYVDDVFLFGTGPAGRAQVRVNSRLESTGAYVSGRVSMDGGPYYDTTVNFLTPQGTHTLTAASYVSGSSAGYSFVRWSDGPTPASRTESISANRDFTAIYALIPDFTVSAVPNSIPFYPGTQPQSSTVSVVSRNGFAGTVSVTASSSRSGITASPSPKSVVLAAGGTSSYTLTISVDSSVPAGTYSVALAGVSGSLSTSTSITVSVSSGGGSGGGSPHLGAFDGQSWVLDNNLMPAAEHSNGQDVTDHYLIQKEPVSVYGHYMLRISEFENAHNYIDQVRLLAVDHGEGYNVGVSPSGEVLTYADPMHASRAWTSNGTDVTQLLRDPDGAYYQQFLADVLIISFSNIQVSDTAKFLVRSDPPCNPMCVKSWFDVSVLATNGTWLDVADIFPRKAWSTDIVDLSPLLPFLGGRVVVRMGFDNAHGHRIDFAGLDVSPQQSTTIIELSLRAAVHSDLGGVATLVTRDDQRYAEIVPGEAIVFAFAATRQSLPQRDFIIIVNGYYVPVML